MIHNTKHRISLILILLISTVSCSSVKQTERSDKTLQATLWIQNSAEYEALTRTVYEGALDALDSVIAKNESVYLNQSSHSEADNLPQAIILDVDETVLDNSPFQARMIIQNSTFTPESWDTWVQQADADPIPGVKSFLDAAVNRDIQLFYVTNREASQEAATIENLKNVGIYASEDNVLTKNEQPGWTSKKESRRAFIAQNYNIIMLIGDDLNDFFPAKEISQEERASMVERHHEKWGYQWFVLPNPVYGSWDQILSNQEQTPLEQLNPKYK